MPHEPGPPLPIPLLLPKETKITITLRIHLNTGPQHESLRDRSFHLGHRPHRLGTDIRTNAMTSMHYERALVHTGFR